MAMELTENNRAEIRLIAQEVVKEYALNVKDDIKNLTRDLKEMLTNHNMHIDGKLNNITQHFSDEIKLLIAERKNDINTEKAERAQCKSDSEVRFIQIETQLKQVGTDMLTSKDIYIAVGKMFGGIIGFGGLIVAIIELAK